MHVIPQSDSIRSLLLAKLPRYTIMTVKNSISAIFLPSLHRDARVGMYSGSQHIDGTLEHLEAERLGSVYSILKELEPHFKDRQPVKCVGILQSDAQKP